MSCESAFGLGALPRLAQDDVGATIGAVLQLGSLGHFSAGAVVLSALRDAPSSTPAERAVCRALLALTCAAFADVPGARELARQAVHDTARPAAATAPDQLRLLCLARALAVNASLLIGDRVYGRRASQARFLAGDRESDWLMRATLELPWQDAPPSVRRYAKYVAAVHRRYAQRAGTGVQH
jgi:hypothetical protein